MEFTLPEQFDEFADALNALANVAVVAAKEQMRSERMKTELITNVSHDIKTPLTSLINYVDLLRKPHTEEEGEMYLEVLQRQSLRLKKLIAPTASAAQAAVSSLSRFSTRPSSDNTFWASSVSVRLSTFWALE